MLSQPVPRRRHTTLFGALASITLGAMMIATPAAASTSSIDPELARKEQEVERLLRNAEAEFWSLKARLDRDRVAREQRLAQAKADYERAQSSVEKQDVAPGSAEHELAAYKADQALEKYQTELERALDGVDAARTELDRIEARVSRFRAALAALRRRKGGPQQSPGQQPSPGVAPDTSGTRAPITLGVGSTVGCT